MRVRALFLALDATKVLLHFVSRNIHARSGAFGFADTLIAVTIGEFRQHAMAFDEVLKLSAPRSTSSKAIQPAANCCGKE